MDVLSTLFQLFNQFVLIFWVRRIIFAFVKSQIKVALIQQFTHIFVKIKYITKFEKIQFFGQLDFL